MLQKLVYSSFIFLSSEFSNFYILFLFLELFLDEPTMVVSDIEYHIYCRVCKSQESYWEEFYYIDWELWECQVSWSSSQRDANPLTFL